MAPLVEAPPAMACEEPTPTRRPGRRGAKAKVASFSKQVLGAALPASLRPQRRRRAAPSFSCPPPAPPMRSGPAAGAVEVPFPAEDDAWVERLRDLSRSMQGGSVFLVGRQRLRPLQEPSCGDGSPAAMAGEAGQESSGSAFKALLWALCDELVSQGYGLSASCAAERLPPELPRKVGGSGGPPRDPHNSTQGDAATGREQVDLRALWELTRQVIAHISVTPGVHVAERAGLPHALWQPLFLVCVGGGQVRVLTVAFVGGPVVGTRPDSKRTPFVLRLATDDLLPAAAIATTAAPSPLATVRYLVEPAAGGARLMLEHVAGVEEELFACLDSGDWGPLQAQA